MVECNYHEVPDMVINFLRTTTVLSIDINVPRNEVCCILLLVGEYHMKMFGGQRKHTCPQMATPETNL